MTGKVRLLLLFVSSCSLFFDMLTFFASMLGEELEFEYEDKGHGSWLCRIK